MKTKRIMAIAMAAVMAAGLLTGCGSSGGGGSKETTAAAAKETTTAAANTGGEETTAAAETEGTDYSMYMVTEPVTIDFWYNGSNNEEFYNKLAEEFNSSQEYVTVNPMCIGGYKAIKEQFVAAQTAGTGLPGALLINAPSLPAYVDSESLEPLNDYIAAYNVDVSDIATGYMEQGKFGDEYYAFPHGASMGIWFYNKTKLAELGYDKFPETWEEFKAWAKDVYEKTGKPAVTVDASSTNTIYNLIMNFGGALIKDDGTSDLMNDDVIKGFKELKELIDAGYMHWDIESGEVGNTMFYNGDTFAIDNTNTSYDEVNDGGFEVGMAWPVEAVHGYSSVAGGWICIPSQLDQMQKNAAFQWVAYLTSADVNLEWCKFSHYSVTHKSVYTDEAKMADIYDDFADMRIVYENIDNLQPKVKNIYYDSAEKSFKTYLNTIFVEGADFDSTWADMVEEIDYILAGN